MAQLQALQAQQNGTQAWCHTFNKNLGVGSTGDDITALFTALTKEDIISQYDSPGSVRMQFYEETATSVIKFQAKYGILQTGYVGPLTRAKLNALYKCGTTSTPTPTQSLITISFPQANSNVSFPLTVTGSINSNWGRFEGTAGTAQLYFWVGSMMAGDWQKIGTPVSITVDNWTSPTTNFHFTANLNNSGIGLANGTKMKIILTEENASGLGTPDTFELPIILNSTTLSTYKNNKYGFEFNYPVSWQTETGTLNGNGPAGNNESLFKVRKSDESAIIYFDIKELGSTDLGIYYASAKNLQEYLNLLSNKNEKGEIIRKFIRNITVAGQTTYEYELYGWDYVKQLNDWSPDIYWQQGNNIYRVSTAGASRDDILSILSTFKFVAQ